MLLLLLLLLLFILVALFCSCCRSKDDDVVAEKYVEEEDEEEAIEATKDDTASFISVRSSLDILKREPIRKTSSEELIEQTARKIVNRLFENIKEL